MHMGVNFSSVLPVLPKKLLSTLLKLVEGFYFELITDQDRNAVEFHYTCRGIDVGIR